MLYGPESNKFWAKADKITETTGIIILVINPICARKITQMSLDRSETEWSQESVPQKEIKYFVPVNSSLGKTLFENNSLPGLFRSGYS